MSSARNTMIQRTRASDPTNTPEWAQRREAFDAAHAARVALGSFTDALTPERADARDKAEAARRLANAHETVAALLADLEQVLSERDGAVSRIAELREKIEAATERLKLVVAASGAAKAASAPQKPAKNSAERAELRKLEHLDAGAPRGVEGVRALIGARVGAYYDAREAETRRQQHQDEARAAMVFAARKQ